MFSLGSSGAVVLLAAGLMAVACASTRTQSLPGGLTPKVEKALVDAPITKPRQINVETYRDFVEPSAFVDSSAEESANRARTHLGVARF